MVTQIHPIYPGPTELQGLDGYPLYSLGLILVGKKPGWVFPIKEAHRMAGSEGGEA